MLTTKFHLQNFYIQGDKENKYETYDYYGKYLGDTVNAEDRNFEM